MQFYEHVAYCVIRLVHEGQCRSFQTHVIFVYVIGRLSNALMRLRLFESAFVVEFGDFDVAISFFQQPRFESFLLLIFTVNDEEGFYF